VALIEGEAGIGKTRLVAQLLAALQEWSTRTLVVCCPPLRTPCTLGPVTDAVRQATEDVADLELSGLAGALRPLFPEWVDSLPPAPESLEDATATRYRLFRALAELLDRLDVGLLVIEDAHWADEATLEFLLFLVSRRRRSAHLVATYRPEDTPEGSLLRRLSRLAAGSTGLRLALPPLDVAQTAYLVSSMLAGESVSTEFAAFVHERTEGLPLAIEESVRLMGDRADLAFRHGGWARRHLADIEVPPTVRDAVLERTARLSFDAVAILRAASVLSEAAPEPIVMTMAGLNGESARTGLRQALGCGLITENFLNGQGLAFRHALAARAVYEAIPYPLRRELHQRAGQALQSVPVPSPARLTRHFREAGDTANWARYADQAADLALAAGDYKTAAATLHDLIANAGLTAQATVRLVRKIPLDALTGSASVQDLIRSLRLLLGGQSVTADDRAEVGCQLGRLLLNAREYAAGAEELEQAIPALAHKSAQAAHAMILLGWPAQTLRPAVEHRRWLDRGWAAAQDPTITDDDRLLLAVSRASSLLLLGEEAGWAAAADLPTATSNPRQTLQVTRGLLNTGELAMLWGRLDEARRRVIAAIEMTRRHDYPRLCDSALVTLVHLDWFTGAWDGLAERARAAAGFDELLVRQEALLVAALLEAAAGHHPAAEKKLQVVVDSELRSGDVNVLLEAVAALCRLQLAAGQPDDVLARTEDAVKVITAKGTWLWATEVAPVRVQALVATDRTGDAAQFVAAFAAGLRGRTAAAPAAALLLCRALLAEAAGERGRAAAGFGRAAAAWQVLPRPYDALLAQERQAYCLLHEDRGDAAALALLSETRRGLDTLGAGADARRVASVLREHGVTIRRGWRGGRRGYGDQLSPRELEVVRLVTVGRTNREIGQALSRSPRTVDTQLKSAMRKLGASSRTELAVRAVENGTTLDDQTPGQTGGSGVAP
jgi:DNA-binding CsgD family transcriptional regulator